MIRDDILLSPYARKLVRFKARCMALQPAFSNENAEDLAQELTVRLFHGLSCFDSEKGHPNLLVATIVGRSAAELIRSRVRGKRLKPGAEVTHEVDELVAEPNDPSQVDLRLDLSPVLSKLPAELRALANQLMQRSVAALARELSLPQSTLRRRMAKLRTAFETAALDDYL